MWAPNYEEGRPKRPKGFPTPPESRRIKEGEQPDPPPSKHQFKIHKSRFGWVVSERRKNIEKRFWRSNLVTWSYEILSWKGEFRGLGDMEPVLSIPDRMPPFRTKEKAQEWLTKIIKDRKEIVLFFNESDLI